MNIYDWIQVILYIAVLIALVKPLGGYMARVYQGERTFLNPIIGPVERFIYRLAGVKAAEEMDWKRYAKAMLVFNLLGFLAGICDCSASRPSCPLTRQAWPQYRPTRRSIRP